MANSKEKVSELIRSLYEMIDEAKGSFNGMCRIDRDKALDILDEVNRLFPVEVDESERIITQRNALLNQAQQEAESLRQQAQFDAAQTIQQAEAQAASIVEDAEEKARRIIDASELQNRIKAKAEEIMVYTKKFNEEKIQQAEEQAAQTIAQAERRAETLKRAANEYCEDVLHRSEEALNEALGEVKESRARFMQLLDIAQKNAAPRPAAFDAEQEE